MRRYKRYTSLNFGDTRSISDGNIKNWYLSSRYLDRWEKVHFLGEEADRGSDDDEESRHKRWSARALHSVPLTYNYQQHNIAGEWVKSAHVYALPSSFPSCSLLSPQPRYPYGNANPQLLILSFVCYCRYGTSLVHTS